MVNHCWMFPASPPCFILGGRYGDILQMMPCFYEIRKRTGQTPVVITSHTYANVFDGVSYVDIHQIREGWWEMIPRAKQLAREYYGNAQVVQFWHLTPTKGDEIGFRGAGFTTLQCHGANHGVNLSLDPDYGTSMARRCGFSREEWIKLPLFLDRRNLTREAELVKGVLAHEQKPVLLYNFRGNSSPFPAVPELMNPLMQRFNRHFRLLDLGTVKAHRIYDLLGLYERAALLVTSDTATAHLAVGSNIPAIWFLADGWTGSVPRGHCVFSCRYSQVGHSVPKVLDQIEQIRITHGSPSHLVKV